MTPGDFAVAGADTTAHKDQKNWINVASCNMGGHRAGGGGAGLGDDTPLESVSFAYAQATPVQDPQANGDGSVRFIRDTVDGGTWRDGDGLVGGFATEAIDAGIGAGGRDVLIGGAGADVIEIGAGNRGHLVVGVDDVHLKAMLDDRVDIIVGSPGAMCHVKAFDGATGAEIRSFLPYDQGGAAAASPGHVKAFTAYDVSSCGEGPDLDAIIAAGDRHDPFDQGFIGGIFVPAADVDAGKGGPGLVIYAGFQL